MKGTASPASLWICDVNGVLIDSTALVRNAFAATALRFGIPAPQERLRQVSGLMLLDAYRTLDPAGDPVAPASFHLAYVRERIASVSAYQDVAPMLAAARHRGVRIAVVTSYGEVAEACLVRTGLYQFIECLVTQQEVRRPKPDPESLVRVLDLLGPDREWCRERAVYVGDTVVDVRAGRAAGIETVGVAYGVSDEAELQAAHPDRVIQEFREMRMFLPEPHDGTAVVSDAHAADTGRLLPVRL